MVDGQFVLNSLLLLVVVLLVLLVLLVPLVPLVLLVSLVLFELRLIPGPNRDRMIASRALVIKAMPLAAT